MTARRDVLEDLEDEPIRYPLAHGLTALLYLRKPPKPKRKATPPPLDPDPWDSAPPGLEPWLDDDDRRAAALEAIANLDDDQRQSFGLPPRDAA